VRSVVMAMVRGWIPACVGRVDGEVHGWPVTGRRQVVVCRAGDAKCARALSTEGRPLVKDLWNVRGTGERGVCGIRGGASAL
jgi:hypothetical protein